MPMLGPTRVNGAFYSFLAECEALTGEKWSQFAGENQVSWGGLAVVVMEASRGAGEKRCLAPDFLQIGANPGYSRRLRSRAQLNTDTQHIH
jgi:hypothetical protein